MAIVHVALATVRGRADTGATLPLAHAIPRGAQTITTTGASQVTATPSIDGEVCLITVEGGPVFAKFAIGTPDATVADGTRWRLIPGCYSFDVDTGHLLSLVSA